MNLDPLQFTERRYMPVSGYYSNSSRSTIGCQPPVIRPEFTSFATITTKARGSLPGARFQGHSKKV